MFTEGIKLEIRIGKNVPAPAPFELAEALQQVEVNHNEEGHSGFELNFQAGRCGKGGLQEYPLLDGGLLEPLNRVILVVTIRSIPYILMDGIITRHQLLPRSTDGESSLVVIGEDVSLMMDMNERPAGHVSMNDREIVESILGSSDYSQYGIVSEVSDPPTSENPDPDERTPTQRNTDLRYLRELAGRHGFVFYIVPGPGSGQNTAYWGPTRQEGVPQRPLSVNMGPFTNVEQINFNYNVLSPTRVTGSVQDRESNEPATLGASSEKPALSSRGLKDPAQIRSVLAPPSGLTTAQTQGRIQGMTDSSAGKTATAYGELDAMCYEGLLWPHRLVEVRGAGRSYDGLWYVNQVSHVLRKSESYKQSFSLSREGLGTTVQQVGQGG